MWCITKVFFIFMKYTDDINIFKLNKDFTAEIDITGTFGHIYHYPQRMNGCLFILCLRGECDITIHLSEHKIQKNDIVTILPETFVHVHRQSPDCRLYLAGFNKELLNGINFFNSTKNYLSALIDTPAWRRQYSSKYQCDHPRFQSRRRDCKTSGSIYYQTLYARAKCSLLCRFAPYITTTPQHHRKQDNRENGY